MLLLILDSLGSTELLFILVMALVFFGPRKLPQLSRSLGKSLAEFRRASEDFKRTWEREVALESPPNAMEVNPDQNSILSTGEAEGIEGPFLRPVPSDNVIARSSNTFPEDDSEAVSAVEAEAPRKQDWL